MTTQMTGTIRRVDTVGRGTVLTADAAPADTVLNVDSAASVSDLTEVRSVRIDGVVYLLSGVDTDLDTITLASGLLGASAEGTPVAALDENGAELVHHWADCQPDDPGDESVPVLMTRETAATVERDQDLAVRVRCEWIRGQYRVMETIDQEPAIARDVLQTQPIVQFTDDGRWGERKGWAIDPATGKRFTLRTGGRNADGTYALVLERWTADGALDDSNIMDRGSGTPIAVTHPLKADVAVVDGELAVVYLNAAGQFEVQRRDIVGLSKLGVPDYPWGTFAKGWRSPAIASDATFSAGPGPVFIAQARNDTKEVRRARYSYGTLTLTQTLIVEGDLELYRDLAHFGLRSDVGGWQVASTNVGARVYVFDEAGTPLPDQHWSTGTTAGLVGIGIDSSGEFYSMDRGGVERRGPASIGSEEPTDIPDLRRTVDLVTGSGGLTPGQGRVEHGQGVIPSGCVVSSGNSLRRAHYSASNSDATYLYFYVRDGDTNALFDGTTPISFIAWWN